MSKYYPAEREPEMHPGEVTRRQKDGYDISRTCWADGEISELYYPLGGFEVTHPTTHKHVFLTADQAHELIQKHAGQMRREEFSWELAFEKK